MASFYEDIFVDGKRNDSLAVSKEIAYPDLLVMTHKKERLVMVFNKSSKPQTVPIANQELTGNEKPFLFCRNKRLANAGSIRFTVPAGDVEVIHIR